MFDRYLSNDTDAFAGVLDQIVALGYMEARTNAGETEYGLTAKGRQWVESGMAKEKPEPGAPVLPGA